MGPSILHLRRIPQWKGVRYSMHHQEDTKQLVLRSGSGEVPTAGSFGSHSNPPGGDEGTVDAGRVWYCPAEPVGKTGEPNVLNYSLPIHLFEKTAME